MNGFWSLGRLGFFAVFFEFAVSVAVEVKLYPRPALGIETAGQKFGVAWLAPESMRTKGWKP